MNIPFRGSRNYITGVDLTEAAVELLGQSGDADVSDISLSCYRMIRKSPVEATISFENLSPSQFDAIVRAQKNGQAVSVGFRAALDGNQEARVDCFEKEQLKTIEVGNRVASIRPPDNVDGSLLTMLVAGIKAASQASFPERKGKWIYAGCRLASLPSVWRDASVNTTSGPEARFFNWQVEVDGKPLGSVMFFVESS
ncbi:hypothetical protein [Paracoccus jiaweipingae]|uniref:hypothetical protein n=1 Tax=unclassified Paracoccus (in: a-proteobacteria) TaxID=2688777 RepID=UPI0037957555